MEELPELIESPELAAYIKVPLERLYRMRAAGKAPRGIRVGRRIVYRAADIEAWLESQADDDRSAAS